MKENVLVRQVLDNILEVYTQEDFKNQLIVAKEKYFKMTGAVNDDDDDFEARMNLFNEWYLFDYIASGHTQPYLYQYIERSDFDPVLAQAFRDVNFSLFEYNKKNFRKQVVIEDHIKNEKFVLHNPEGDLGVVPKDLFIGRIIPIKEENFLLRGMCLLPLEVRPTLIKECKRLRKLKNPQEEKNFLINLENLKTKWRRYGHIDSNKIFVFQKL